MQKYTLRVAHLELGGVNLDFAVEDDVLPFAEHTHEGDLVGETQSIVAAPPQGDLASVGFKKAGIANQTGSRGQGKWRDPRSFRRAKSRSAVDRNAADRSGTMAPAASCGSAGAWEPSLAARGELASNAVLRSSLAQTLAAIGVDTEIEMRSAALRHRQAVAQPVVAPVPGGPDAEARHSDQTPPDRHPVAEFGLQTAARCRASGRHKAQRRRRRRVRRWSGWKIL